jgi:hypothetical protein
MANIKNLKKDIQFVLGDILEAIYIHEMTTTGAPTEATNALVKEAYEVYDDLLAKINDRKVENRGKHIKNVQKELETKAIALVEKVNAL